VIHINLSKEEVAILQTYSTTSPIGLLRQKAQAVLLRFREVKIGDIAFSSGSSYRTVERWLKDFSLLRLASIFSGLVDNENAGKLTRVQKEEIRKTLQQPPSSSGLPKEFWDVPTLKDYVKAEFGVVYESRQSYHFLLKFSQLSFKYPTRFSVRRNEKLIKRRMKTVRKEIVWYLTNPAWAVFCADETRIMLEALTRRAWLRMGEKTILRVNRSREAQNYLGLLNQKTFRCHLYRIARGKQEEIVRALVIHLRYYPQKKICILWDNATCHRGKLLRQELKRGGLLERVHLINFPPYAPDMNPIEHVWKSGKETLSNKQFQTFEKTKAVFERAVSLPIFPYKI
jgi:transposase